MSLKLLAPENKTLPESPARFVSTLLGRQLWSNEYLKLTGPPSPKAIVHVYPATKVLGLRREPDMHTVSELETMIDLEKLIRMALHQSVLAFEVLSGPGFGDLDRSLMIENAFSKSLVENIDQVLVNAENNWERRGGELLVHFNLLLVRFALNESFAATDVQSILEHCTIPEKDVLADPAFDPKESFDLFKKLSLIARKGNTHLPDSPKGYEVLSDYLVKLRLES